jgi:predicted amidohydrolase YtcJ
VRSHTAPATVLHNGRVYTMDADQPLADALAIARGLVVSIGNDSDVVPLATGATEVIDLAGQTVIPGLIDAHIHLQKYAHSLDQVDCEVSDIDTCLERVRLRAEETRYGEWILGHGWNHNEWDRLGTCADLDSVAPSHPVYLTAKSLHAGWANSEALKRAAIGEDSVDPSGGVIVRDQAGKPNGILLETAMSLIQSAIPAETGEQLRRKLIRAQIALWALGITGVHDYDGPRCFDALQRMREADQLGLRVVKNIPLEYLSQAIELGLHTGFGDPTLRLGNVKVFADGALGPRTAAMLSAYDGETDNFGMLMLDGEELLEIAGRASAAGIGTSVHAIGDKANHVVLDAFEALRGIEKSEGREPAKLRIEHLQLMHPDDIHRPAALDVIASMQPIHATSDMPMADRYWGSRSRYAYAWHGQLTAGAVLAFGSDAPVESPNPFWGIHAALTRRRRDGSPGEEGWYPVERISLQQALHAYTRGPAAAAGLEAIQGRLQPGCLADLVMLEADPFRMPAEALAEVKPVGTMVDGVWRYREF